MPPPVLIALPRTPEDLDALSEIGPDAFDAARAWADEYVETPFNDALDAPLAAPEAPPTNG